MFNLKNECEYVVVVSKNIRAREALISSNKHSGSSVAFSRQSSAMQLSPVRAHALTSAQRCATLSIM